MDKIENGNDIIRDIVLRGLESTMRRFCKQCLQRLEDQKLLTPEIRKAVLDSWNDAFRHISSN